MTVDIIKDVWKHHGTAFFPDRDFGEDLSFCKRAQDLGHEIWAEPSVKLGHLGHMVIYPEYRDIFRKSIIEV
jgi:hypothetical protein